MSSKGGGATTSWTQTQTQTWSPSLPSGINKCEGSCPSLAADCCDVQRCVGWSGRDTPPLHPCHALVMQHHRRGAAPPRRPPTTPASSPELIVEKETLGSTCGV
ncbi:hypothetical protein E2C01_006257 [Portunus trituberculatus]|uniref:Uncharacterized protein n=1 Tax=Portunus trituberculatus TaxID=210409 RepID=A0A5B7CVV4_PORTR|nr:hypothetical protein [Portunus trituberculatus]